MKEYRKRIISAVLAAAIAFSYVGITAYAEEVPNDSEAAVTEEFADVIEEEIDSEEIADIPEDISEGESGEVSVDGNIGITAANFPDARFRDYILDYYNSDWDYSLSPSEIQNITYIDVDGYGISSLKGIEYFTALTQLYCSDNNLTSIDVSQNTELIWFNCWNNNLTSLDVSKNTKLIQLCCGNNNLTSLDVSKNTKLIQLYCENNNLTSLDVSKNTKLFILFCHNNLIKSIDISNNKELMSDRFFALPRNYALSSKSLSELKKFGFDPAKASNWSGADYNSSTDALENFTSDYVTFKYKNSNANGSDSTMTLIAPDIPAKPANVKAAAGDKCVTLSWDAVSGASSYTVYSYADGKYTKINGTTATSYKVTGLTNGKTYQFLVRSFNSSCGSDFTTADLVSAVPKGAVPAKPTVKVTAGDKSASLSWGSVSTATSYTVYRLDSGKYTKITDTALTYCTISGLTNGKTYYFLVRAFNANGGSAFTSADLVKVVPNPTTVPSKPTNVKAKAGDKQATLSWTAVSGAVNYAVYKYENGSYGKIAATTNTTYTVKGLTNGTAYKFLVRAFNANGGSTFSTADLVSVTPKAAAVVVPAKPTVTAKVCDKVVTFSWNAVAGATYYKLYNYSNGKYGLIDTTTSTSYRLRYLKNGTTYKILVRAFNANGGSAFTASDLITVTPKAATAVPAVPSVKASVSGGNVTLTWAHIPTAFAYSVYKYENGKYTKLGATCDNSVVLTGLAAGKTYSILVRAFNSAGGNKVSASNRVSVTL